MSKGKSREIYLVGKKGWKGRFPQIRYTIYKGYLWNWENGGFGLKSFRIIELRRF